MNSGIQARGLTLAREFPPLEIGFSSLLFEVTSGKEVVHLTQQEQVGAVAFNEDRRYLAVQTSDGATRVLDSLAEGKYRATVIRGLARRCGTAV